MGELSGSMSCAGMAQSVEHVIGNDEVISSILITSSREKHLQPGWVAGAFLLWL